MGWSGSQGPLTNWPPAPWIAHAGWRSGSNGVGDRPADHNLGRFLSWQHIALNITGN